MTSVATPYDVTTEARARIDEEITKHTLSLCNLRVRRNTLSPIFRLPPETLAAIFIHHARSYHEEYDPPIRWVVASWVNVSYVCSHWRDVALNCPTLWTYHFVVSLRWTEELLARSKQASLKIYILYDGQKHESWWLSLVEKLMAHAERIQELRLDLSTMPTHQVLSKLSSRAPRLQNLVILTNRGLDFEWSSMPFDGDTRALRTLELSDCPMPWYSLKLTGLTTLSLHNIPDPFRQSMVEFLAVLSCMQGLTRLYLHRALASAREFTSSAAFNAFQKINLPHLSHLLIVAPLSTVVALLSCMDIPLPRVRVRIECYSGHDSSLDDYIQLSSLLAQRFGPSEDQALSALTIRSLAIVYTRWATTFAFSASKRDFGSSVSTSHVDWDRNVPLKIFVHLCGLSLRERVDEDPITSDICCTMLLTTVESVHVVDPPFSPTFWRKALGHLQGLRYIKLSRGNMPDLASVLSVSDCEGVENQGGRATSDRGPEHMLAPALKELRLLRITFCEDDSDLSGFAITRRALLDALYTRKATRGRLTMTQCNTGGIDELDMVYLWDGTRRHEVDESDSDSLEGDSDLLDFDD